MKIIRWILAAPYIAMMVLGPAFWWVVGVIAIATSVGVGIGLLF